MFDLCVAVLCISEIALGAPSLALISVALPSSSFVSEYHRPLKKNGTARIEAAEVLGNEALGYEATAVLGVLVKGYDAGYDASNALGMLVVGLGMAAL